MDYTKYINIKLIYTHFYISFLQLYFFYILHLASNIKECSCIRDPLKQNIFACRLLLQLREISMCDHGNSIFDDIRKVTDNNYMCIIIKNKYKRLFSVIDTNDIHFNSLNNRT